MIKKLESAIALIICALIIAISILMLFQGSEINDFLTFGDPYWKNQYLAYDRAPEVATMTLIAIVLACSILLLKRRDEKSNQSSTLITPLTFFELLVIVLSSIIGATLIYLKLATAYGLLIGIAAFLLTSLVTILVSAALIKKRQ